MIDWSAINPQSLAGRLLRLPAHALPRGAVMRIRHGPAKGMKWIAGSSLHGCWLGTYELDKQRALARFVRPGMAVYDIGAQAGFYTLFFSRMAGEAGRVFAFEPCPRESGYLVEHVRINRLANVRVVAAAVSEKPELLGMSIERGVCRNYLCDPAEAMLLTPTVSLDALNFPPPNVIKMDVEGAESVVLRGAQRMLNEARPVVFVALHGEEQRAKCVALLGQARYRLYDLSGRPIAGVPLSDEIYALPPGE